MWPWLVGLRRLRISQNVTARIMKPRLTANAAPTGGAPRHRLGFVVNF